MPVAEGKAQSRNRHDPSFLRSYGPLVKMDFTLARGCFIKFKISHLERKTLRTKEIDLSRRVLLRLRIWGWQDRRTSISKDLKPAGKEQHEPEKVLLSLVWLKRRKNNYFAVTSRSWKPGVDVLRFISKHSGNSTKEVCTGEAVVGKGCSFWALSHFIIRHAYGWLFDICGV